MRPLALALSEPLASRKPIDALRPACFNEFSNLSVAPMRLAVAMPKCLAILCVLPFMTTPAVGPAMAQSFNCRYAKAPDEVLICQNPRLSSLDEEMASAFFKLRRSLPVRGQARLDADQQAWLRARMSCGRDAECIEAAYARRIQQLTPSGGAPALASFPDVSGLWKPLNSDDRLMTIKLSNNKIIIEAPDLRCTLSDFRSPEFNDLASPPSVKATGICDEESETVYTKEMLTVLQVGRDVFLIDASVLVRLVNENSEPKEDENYTNRTPTISLYQRVLAK